MEEKHSERGRTCEMDTFSSTASSWHSVTRSVAAIVSVINVIFLHVIQAMTPSPPAASAENCALLCFNSAAAQHHTAVCLLSPHGMRERSEKKIELRAVPELATRGTARIWAEGQQKEERRRNAAQ